MKYTVSAYRRLKMLARILLVSIAWNNQTVLYAAFRLNSETIQSCSYGAQASRRQLCYG